MLSFTTDEKQDQAVRALYANLPFGWSEELAEKDYSNDYLTLVGNPLVRHLPASKAPRELYWYLDEENSLAVDVDTGELYGTEDDATGEDFLFVLQ